MLHEQINVYDLSSFSPFILPSDPNAAPNDLLDGAVSVQHLFALSLYFNTDEIALIFSTKYNNFHVFKQIYRFLYIVRHFPRCDHL
jgi:hypothetical protein